MKRLLPILLLALISSSAFAQNSYNITSIPYSPDPFANGTNTGIAADDMWGGVITLPFSFCFYDQSYSSIVIGSNGLATFTTSMANTYCVWPISATMPNTSLPDRCIASPWQDINPATGGAIRTDVQGVAPYRRFIISYDQIPMFSCTGLLFSQQVILYETTNIIETHILNKPLCSTWNGGNAIHGIQINSTTAFVVPGRNYPTQWSITNDGYRFTPVGTCAGPAPLPDSMSGKVYSDLNANCVQDVGEPGIANRGILLNGGQFYTWTDNSGNYGLRAPSAIYAVSEYMTGYYLASNCAPGGVQNVNLTGTVTGVDFADSAITSCVDNGVGLAAGYMRRCDSAYLHLTYFNSGSIIEPNATVDLTLVDSLQPYAATAPYTALGGNVYRFAVGALNPGQVGNIDIYVRVGCDTAGTIHCIGAAITGLGSPECNNFNNSDLSCEMVRAAFDPNTKHVAARNFHQRGYVEQDDNSPSDTLTYRIDFQNLGTSYAEDVVIRDYIDTLHLDLASLEVIAGSAPFHYMVIGNELRVYFENIHLPAASVDFDASIGMVKYRIRQRPGNLPCTDILNEGRIYFDNEPAVVTNTTTNHIALPQLDLGPDRILCPGMDVTLTANSDFPSFFWSNGSLDSSITVSNPGTYHVAAYFPNGCMAHDTVTITASTLPTVFLGNDTTVVISTTLSAGAGLQYLWSNGSTASSIVVTQSGDYWVQMTNNDGCVSSDTISIVVLPTSAASAIAAALEVSPQPAADRLHIHLPLPAAQTIGLTIADLRGRVLTQRSLACQGELDTELDLSALPAGTYLLRVGGEGFALSRRIVVMR